MPGHRQHQGGAGEGAQKSSGVVQAIQATPGSIGYVEDGRGALAPRGVSREMQRFRITADGWRSRPRPPVDIQGFDGCRAMFGID